MLNLLHEVICILDGLWLFQNFSGIRWSAWYSIFGNLCEICNKCGTSMCFVLIGFKCASSIPSFDVLRVPKNGWAEKLLPNSWKVSFHIRFCSSFLQIFLSEIVSSLIIFRLFLRWLQKSKIVWDLCSKLELDHQFA